MNMMSSLFIQVFQGFQWDFTVFFIVLANLILGKFLSTSEFITKTGLMAFSVSFQLIESWISRGELVGSHTAELF